MLISVVIPVYNVEKYLRNCVESVIDKDYKDYEIILVDDGSTDGKSPELCDILAAEHPELIRVIHQENMGLGGARNTGIKHSEGEYLLFIDSDDSVVEGTVSLLADKIKATGADIIAFNFCDEFPNGSRVNVNANYISSDTPFSLSEHPEFLLSLPTACGRIWRKALFTESGIKYPCKVWYEDIRTSTKLFALAEKIVTIPDILYIYYQREGSIMRSSDLNRNREIIDAFDDILSWYRENGLYDVYKDILCRLAIDNVYIPASVRVLREDVKHPLLKEFSDYMDTNFPSYGNNPYINQLPKFKLLAFNLLRGRHYRLLRLLFKIKGS